MEKNIIFTKFRGDFTDVFDNQKTYQKQERKFRTGHKSSELFIISNNYLNIEMGFCSFKEKYVKKRNTRIIHRQIIMLTSDHQNKIWIANNEILRWYLISYRIGWCRHERGMSCCHSTSSFRDILSKPWRD